MPRPQQTLTAISARRDARGIASPDGMANYLDTMLAEADQALAACAAPPGLATPLRDALAALAAEVRHLRRYLRWTTRGAAPGVGGGETLPGITRALLKDVERAALCDAFRGRCRDLGGRVADPELASAAVAELRTGLNVLARAFGVRAGDRA